MTPSDEAWEAVDAAWEAVDKEKDWSKAITIHRMRVDLAVVELVCAGAVETVRAFVEITDPTKRLAWLLVYGAKLHARECAIRSQRPGFARPKWWTWSATLEDRP